MAGRPAHSPTDSQRAEVRALAGFGVREDEIARYLKIAPKTLRKHYRSELDNGTVHANAQVARKLFLNATENNNVAAQIFWLKARAGWSEKFDFNHNGIIPPTTIKLVAATHATRKGSDPVEAA